MLIVVLCVCVPRRVIIPVLEGHDCRSSQDEAVWERTLQLDQVITVVDKDRGRVLEWCRRCNSR